MSRFLLCTKKRQCYALYIWTSVVLQFSRELTFQDITIENKLTVNYDIHINTKTAKFYGDKQVTKVYNTAGSQILIKIIYLSIIQQPSYTEFVLKWNVYNGLVFI